jgi:flagellar hook-associated protein 3
MRIDSMTYFNSSLAGMRDNQSGIARLNQQIATDQRLLQPKDDPLATEEILDLSNRVVARTQYASNQDRASIALKYESTVLTEMRDTLNGAKALLAGSVASSDAGLRDVTAQELQGLANQLLDLANTRDPSGNYIFGGFDTVNRPFANPLDGTVSATTYGGTPNPGGTRSIEVEVGRLVQVNDNLDGVFQHGVAGSDLLQELDDAITNLAVTTTLSQADLTGWMAVVDTCDQQSGRHQLSGVGGLWRGGGCARHVQIPQAAGGQNALSDLQKLGPDHSHRRVADPADRAGGGPAGLRHDLQPIPVQFPGLAGAPGTAAPLAGGYASSPGLPK